MPTAALADIPRAVLRHKWKALLVFLLIAGAAGASAFLLPKSYHSECKLFVRLGKENALLDQTATLSQDPVVAMPQSMESEINSIVEILHSQVVAEKVVDRLGPAFILAQGMGETSEGTVAAATGAAPSPAGVLGSLRTIAGSTPLAAREQAVVELLDDYSVTPGRRSDIIAIECKGRSPKWAQSVTAAIADAYLDEHIRLHRPKGYQEFFEDQTVRLRKELTEKEETLRDLKTSTGLTSVVDQRQTMLTRIGRLQDELLQAEGARVASERRVQSLREELAVLPAMHVESQVSGVGNEGTDQMRAQLYGLEVRREEAAAKYTPAHPLMQEIEDQLRQCRQAVASQEATRTHVTTSTNKLHQETQMALLQEGPSLDSLQARSAKLSEQLTSARGQLASLNENELRIAVLQREVEMLQANYCKYAANLEQAKIKQAMEIQRISNISVALPATFEPKSVAPRKTTILGLGFIAGLLGAVAAALLAQWRDPYLRTPDDVQRLLGLSVLGAVPRFRPRNRAFAGNGQDQGMEEGLKI